jgi:hypothetical protein
MDIGTDEDFIAQQYWPKPLTRSFAFVINVLAQRDQLSRPHIPE